MKNRITIHITTRARHTELALLLENLRHQTIQNWDLIILDDASGNHVVNAYFITALINRLKLENQCLGRSIKWNARLPITYDYTTMKGNICDPTISLNSPAL